MVDNTSQHDTTSLDRRDFLGGLSSLAAAAAFSLTVPRAAAEPVTEGPDDPVQTVTSPDGSLELTVDVQDGSPSYTVAHDGTTVVGESGLGFDFRTQSSFGTGVEVTGSERSTTDETWTPVWDQYDEIRDNHAELRLGLQESADPGRSMTLVARAFDDGVAFRYVFPEDSGFGEFAISAERTEFAFEGDHTSWWIENDYNSYEYPYRETKLSEIGPESPRTGAHTPITMETADGKYLSVHEADLVDYAAMGLVPTDTATTLESDLAPLPDGTKVTASAPHRTPWRTIQVADRAGALVESSLVLNCNEPRDPADFPQGTDWIEPGKFIGIWWLMITGRAEWQYQGPATGNHPAQTGRMKQYMDFASEHGIRSVLVEGWNEGWDSYPGSGDTMDFDESYPDFDLREVVDYGQSLDPPVEMTAHNETAGNITNYESQLTADPGVFADYDDLGIHSIKTGYVADSGVSIDGQVFSHHCQPLVNHHHLVYRHAARHRQMLEIHEPVKPTGERRRFPNVMTREGVFGQEYDSFGSIDPSHHVTLPFTRMLAGPVEFTPGIFDMDSGSGGIETTRAKQLAMYPTYLSGLHMVADLPSSYLEDRTVSPSVGEVAQAEFGAVDGLPVGARWSNAQGERYVRFARGDADTGANVSWTVQDVPADGEYEVHVRYATVRDGQSITLSANGSETALAFPATEYWDEWATVSQPVSLTAGENTVALELTSGDPGGMNVDSIAVTRPGEPMPEPETAPIRGPTVPEFAFIEDVPAAGWDDTRVVDAEIREYTVTARRSGEEWFLGVMTGTDARTLDVDLSFLDSGTDYVAELYTDGADASFDTNLADVRVDEALVDSETTLLASMVESGGLAARLRPATDDELDSLTAYEYPEQELGATIDASTLTGSTFATVTGTNDAGVVGGSIVELVVDGDAVETRNVRAAPDSEKTVTFAHTFDTGGTYDVAVRTRDGRTVSSQSVTVINPQSVAGVLDPLNDDDGPGSYTYPTSSAFRNGAMDFRFFRVSKTPDRYRFAFQVDALYDALDAENGFSPHAFLLWMHDPTADGGRTDGRDDLGVNAEFAKPWHYRLVVSGSSASLVDADGNALLSDPSTLGVEVKSEDAEVIVSVPRSAFRGSTVADFAVVTGVHSMQDGRLRPVEVEATDTAFGGADPDAIANAPRIADLVTPQGVMQADALSYSSDEVATLPFRQLKPGDGEPAATPEPTAPEPTTTRTAEPPTETTPTTQTGTGGGPGFGLVSGVLGAAGGIAYAAKQMLGPDAGTDEE